MTKTIQTMTIATILVAGLVTPAFTSDVFAASGFAGDYDPTNWTLTNTNTNGSVDISGAPTSIALIGGNNGGVGSGDTDYTIPVACGGDISFDWTYQSFDRDGPRFDPAGYLVNGVFTQLSDNSGPNVQSGTTTVTVSDGDVFGYRVHTTDNILGEGAFTNITNLQTPDCIIEVEIDIKPGSDPSSVSCKNDKGVVPVAIFGSEDFDASTIDIELVSMSLVGSEPILVTEAHNKIHLEDINGDGFDDAVLHLEKAEVCLVTEDQPKKRTFDVILSGESDDGTFQGIGDIRIVN